MRDLALVAREPSQRLGLSVTIHTRTDGPQEERVIVRARDEQLRRVGDQRVIAGRCQRLGWSAT